MQRFRAPLIKIGRFTGVLIPKEVLKDLNLKSGGTIKIFVSKPLPDIEYF